jgi:hypothetical protein
MFCEYINVAMSKAVFEAIEDEEPTMARFLNSKVFS